MSDLTRLTNIEDVYDDHEHHIGRIGELPSGALKIFKKQGPNGFLPITDRSFRASERDKAKEHIKVTVGRGKPQGRPIR